MLREAGIAQVVDVRSFPRSRSNPAYNIDIFAEQLSRIQIQYRHMPDLGGRRPKQSQVEPSVNALWRVQSFHNYADYAMSPDFQRAFQSLLRLGSEKSVAMMCSEAVWWRCHRRIIADYLLHEGHPVVHLMAPGRMEEAKPTPGSIRRLDGIIVYPAQ
ncbi:DUF488 domain-containing protein [Mesorhizobium sp. 10J20-29]